MKRIITISVVVISLLLFGMAGAGEIPKHMQDAYIAENGTQATLLIWFPVAPELPGYQWTNFLIVSNFNSSPVNVSCWFTNYSNVQTMQTYTLGQFQKRIIEVDNIGSDTIFDIACISSRMFGASLLLLDTASFTVLTSFPPIVMTY